MAASQGQLQVILILKVLMVTHNLHFLPQSHVKEEQIFIDFLSKRFNKKYKHLISFHFFFKNSILVAPQKQLFNKVM